ncbi:MAG: rod shape-determining protein MreC [Alistipes sp.]|nr:rod shape-determining protein MreC [Alistipes sp.]MBQ8543870.1 rod shape-determining protein MreC [Alistipes sp.]
MYRLIEFLRRIYVVLLFIAIEAIALNFYAHSSYYTQAKILSRAHSVAGGIQSSIFGVKHYFTLRSENEALSQRVAELEGLLSHYREKEATAATDSLSLDGIDSTMVESLSQYRYTTARIISNSISRSRNFITLNRGLMHGVVVDMAVISPTGVMIGYVVGCSERYSVVLPMLNMDFRTSGKIVGDEHFGSISWSGKSPYKVEMNDLSKHADIEIGDEVVSAGLSHYFPEGIKIGYVESYSINDTQTSYNVTVRLAADMTKLNNVILIENFDYGEIQALENNPQNEEYN